MYYKYAVRCSGDDTIYKGIVFASSKSDALEDVEDNYDQVEWISLECYLSNNVFELSTEILDLMEEYA